MTVSALVVNFMGFLHYNSSDIHPSWYTNSPNTVSVKSTAKRSVEDSDEDDCLLKVIY